MNKHLFECVKSLVALYALMAIAQENPLIMEWTVGAKVILGFVVVSMLLSFGPPKGPSAPGTTG